MAEDIIFKVGIDSDGSGAKSLKSLKAEFRQLQQELEKTQVGTKAYQQALERLGNVKDEIGDLNQTIKALNPEGKVQAFANVAGKLAGGFQAATGAAALFGAQSEELEKQLLKVQAATALAQGIQSVIGLADAFKVLGVVIAANPIISIATVITGIVAAVVSFTRENEKLTSSLDSQKAALDSLRQSYDDYLTLIEASGSSYEEIAVARVEAYEAEIAQLDLLKKEYDELFSISEEGSKEQKDAEIEWTKISNEQAKLRHLIKLEFVKADKFVRDKDIKDAEDAEKARNDRAKLNHEIFLREKRDLDAQGVLAEQEQQKEFDEIFNQLEAESQEADLTAYVDFAYRKMLAGLEVEKQGLEQSKQINAAAQVEKDKQLADEMKMQQAYFSAVSDLSATYFSGQLANAKGNAAKENEIRKKQFQVDKALRATQAAIDTLRGVAAAAPVIPLQIAVGVSGAALVTKILSTQYNQPSTSLSGDIASSAPQIQTNAPQTINQPITQLSESGQNLSQNIRAYVVETDITDSQDRVRRLQEQGTF